MENYFFWIFLTFYLKFPRCRSYSSSLEEVFSHTFSLCTGPVHFEHLKCTFQTRLITGVKITYSKHLGLGVRNMWFQTCISAEKDNMRDTPCIMGATPRNEIQYFFSKMRLFTLKKIHTDYKWPHVDAGQACHQASCTKLAF